MSVNDLDYSKPENRVARGVVGAAAAGGALALLSEAIGRWHESQVPPDGEWAAVNGHRLHYVDRGAGPPIVLVHGLGGQLRNFTYALSGELEGAHRVVALDRPGSGYSDAAPGPHPGIAEQAHAVAGLIEHLGLDRPLLVGHSLGGAVSLALALERPELVRGLALLTPLTQPMDDVPAVFRMLAVRSGPLRTGLLRTLAVPLAKLTRAQAQRAVFAPEEPRPDFGVRGGGLLALRPGNMDRAARDLMAAHAELPCMASRYGTLDLPVSILFGRDDALLDPVLHGEVTAAAIPHARLKLIEGGHMVPVTRPDQTARFVEDAFSRR